MSFLFIEIDLQPILDSAMRELKDAVESEEERFLKDLAVYAPDEMRRLMDTAPRTGTPATRTTGTDFIRSATGEIPAIDSFDLYDSIFAEVQGNSIVMQFAEHAKWLDPLIGESDAYLNRPFAEQGIENAVRQLQAL